MAQSRPFDRHKYRQNSADSCPLSQDAKFCNCNKSSSGNDPSGAVNKRASSSSVTPLWQSMQDYNDHQGHSLVLDDSRPVGGSPDYVVVMRMQTHSADSSCSTSTTNIHKHNRKHRGSSGSNSLDSNPGGGQTPKRIDQQQAGNLLMWRFFPHQTNDLNYHCKETFWVG
uniref:Uncharacterized protein n=1 Tax=Romanomermis culicivorax TaxID=13658 RepID=A0A915IY27_ROMCU